MNVIIIISRVTFVPENYFGFVEALLKLAPRETVGIVLLDNLDWGIVKKAIGAGLLGARRISVQIFRNIFYILSKDRRHTLCSRLNIPIFQCTSVNEPRCIQWLKNLDPDLIVNARTRCMFSAEVLKLPRLGCVNIHHGLLPEERGVMCDLHALALNKPTGFSIHKMTEKLDDGEILSKHIVSLEGKKNYLELTEYSSKLEAMALWELIASVQREDSLPNGKPNQSEKVVYRKSIFTRTQVNEIKKMGVLL